MGGREKLRAECPAADSKVRANPGVGMHAQWSSQGCACAESVCVTRLQCASPALASRHNPWDTLTHAIASISPGLDAPSFQIDRNDWPHQDKRRQVRNNMMF